VLLFKTGIITAVRTWFSYTLNQHVNNECQPWWPRSNLGIHSGCHAGYDTQNYLDAGGFWPFR